MCLFVVYECHKTNPNCGGSYIDSPHSIKNKKASIDPINKKYHKCFQYAVPVAINHEEIGKNSETITKVEPFINKYNWEGINFPSGKDGCKEIEKNNLVVFLLKKKKN